MDDIAQHPRPLPQEPQAQHPDRELFPFLTDEFIDGLSDAEAKSWLCCLHSSIRKTTSIAERRDALKFWRDFARRGEDYLAEQKRELAKKREQEEAAEAARKEAAKKEAAGDSVSAMIRNMINNGGGSFVPMAVPINQSGETNSLTDNSFQGATSQHAARGPPLAHHGMAGYQHAPVQPQYPPVAHLHAQPTFPSRQAQAPMHAQHQHQFAEYQNHAAPHGPAPMHAQHQPQPAGYQNRAAPHGPAPVNAHYQQHQLAAHQNEAGYYGQAQGNANPSPPAAAHQNRAAPHGPAPMNAHYQQHQLAAHQNQAGYYGHGQPHANPSPRAAGGYQNRAGAHGHGYPPPPTEPRPDQGAAHGHGQPHANPPPPAAGHGQFVNPPPHANPPPPLNPRIDAGSQSQGSQQGSPAAAMDMSDGDEGRPNTGGGAPMES